MRTHALTIGAAAAAVFALPQLAAAEWGQVTTGLNLRTCASVQCSKVAVMPAGARVWIDGSQGGWYYLTYNGVRGYASGNFISTRFANAPAPNTTRRYAQFPPPPPYGYYRQPSWNSRYGAWYDGRRWYYNGRWQNNRPGVSFGFSFGG